MTEATEKYIEKVAKEYCYDDEIAFFDAVAVKAIEADPLGRFPVNTATPLGFGVDHAQIPAAADHDHLVAFQIGYAGGGAAAGQGQRGDEQNRSHGGLPVNVAGG